ncbi:hypothetical protein [Desulfoplanes formicivorans]|uniref:Uncharacterized protein n=1 Tax=Desulfoplanes formicivorans TaxID=1592317 RepID=A0A194AE34_9BACT|nr:hypothetical protein [Desulfoplanes formicivorans]GAU07460.1 hypothetical protein DPF_0142 [Desulfoplanes formicivorans]
MTLPYTIMITIPINNPLRISVPRIEGCWLQTDAQGLNLNLNFPGTTLEEMHAFTQGVRSVGLFAADTCPPIPFLILTFNDKVFGPVEGSFDARSQYGEYLKHFMNLPLPVRMGIFLSDMGRIKGICHVPLPPKVTLALRTIIRRQLETEYTTMDFARVKLNVQTAYTTRQLLENAAYIDE